MPLQRWTANDSQNDFHDLATNRDKFEKIKPKLIELAEKTIEFDGYARMGHVFKSTIGFEQLEYLAYYRSISAILISEGKNIREPILDAMGQVKDYQVLKDPNYELTEITKKANQSAISVSESSIKTNNSIIETNASLQQTNNSTRELNYKTDGYYNQLKKATWWIAIATVVTALATIVNVAVTILESHKPQNNKEQSHMQSTPQKDTSLKMQTKIP